MWMQLTVNGESRSFEGESLSGLLTELKLDGKPCAIEINRQLVPASKHAEQLLCDGDAVEILTLVGGG